MYQAIAHSNSKRIPQRLVSMNSSRVLLSWLVRNRSISYMASSSGGCTLRPSNKVTMVSHPNTTTQATATSSSRTATSSHITRTSAMHLATTSTPRTVSPSAATFSQTSLCTERSRSSFGRSVEEWHLLMFFLTFVYCLLIVRLLFVNCLLIVLLFTSNVCFCFSSLLCYDCNSPLFMLLLFIWFLRGPTSTSILFYFFF